jgi:hypothetical protein
MDERYGVTDDYFDAVLVADGVAVRMSDNVAVILTQLAGRLIRFLETGEVEQQGRRALTPNKMLRRLFPDAYRGSAEARAFRDRHAAALRDSNAPRLVHARCGGGTECVIAHAEVDDWLTTLGLARLLTTPRDATTMDMTGIWINHMQECLITAINPRLAPFTMKQEAGPRTIRGG